VNKKELNLSNCLIEEWRNLGFFYEIEDRIDINQWRFHGSKSGLQNFVTLLENYTTNADNEMISEHEHYGL